MEMDIGIVTSCYNYYDRFLKQWLTSIQELKRKPKFISIVVSGDAYDENNIIEAEEQLKLIGVPYKITFLKEHLGMGYARNEAVKHSPTEWIQYLDIDDIILPKAITYYSRYKKEADVISGGFRVVGDREEKSIIFKNISNELAIKGKYVSCSHGVYKKKLWEKRPYITKNDYVDQPLWLGFAQLGARFVGTKEICTLYITRKDGHNMSLTQEEKREAKKQYDSFVKEGVNDD